MLAAGTIPTRWVPIHSFRGPDLSFPVLPSRFLYPAENKHESATGQTINYAFLKDTLLEALAMDEMPDTDTVGAWFY